MKNKGLEPNIDLLKKIYRFFYEAIEHIDVECQKKCSSCCTCNVTMTSLEAGFLINSLTPQEKKKLNTRLEQHSPKKRYIPKMTTNMFARLCRQGNEIPDEENDPAWGQCPMLVDKLCSIYDARPFGCRALLSQVHCRGKGYAQIPPFVLTINTLFLQTIEHLDQKGFTGNLSDMLALFLSDSAFAGFTDRFRIADDARFILNEKISILMVPPEHLEKVRPLLEKLSCLL